MGNRVWEWETIETKTTKENKRSDKQRQQLNAFRVYVCLCLYLCSRYWSNFILIAFANRDQKYLYRIRANTFFLFTHSLILVLLFPFCHRGPKCAALCNIDGSILERVLYTDIVSRIFFFYFAFVFSFSLSLCMFQQRFYCCRRHCRCCCCCFCYSSPNETECAHCVFGGGIILHETYERAIPVQKLL